MEKLKRNLDNLTCEISDLEMQISKARKEAESNIAPLKSELEKVRREKRDFGLKNDFESVRSCISREKNLKFKIASQWNRHSLLNEKLSRLKEQRQNLEEKIKLENDKAKRTRELKSKMDAVAGSYRKTQSLKNSAVESKIHPETVLQWFEWGLKGYGEIYVYFHSKIKEIDDEFAGIEQQKLKKQMDSVAEAYKKTGSLKKASEIADVSYDTVQYWYKWGMQGFGEENTYFYKKIEDIR